MIAWQNTAQHLNLLDQPCKYTSTHAWHHSPMRLASDSSKSESASPSEHVCFVDAPASMITSPHKCISGGWTPFTAVQPWWLTLWQAACQPWLA
jgi:hypothetical protein